LLLAAGYSWIGLDHFARDDDALAVARREGRLRRNFQGYTSDASEALIGLGASSISSLPWGYAQNVVAINDYARAVKEAGLTAARGIALSADDIARRAIIERLMCDLTVDLRRFDGDFAAEHVALAEMEADGLIIRDATRLTVTARGRPFLRAVCAVFDRYLARPERARHARAV
jgi:oxygen-independent coproporphyrinogen-3 oxidase